jgi:hypothetical protein
MLGHINFIRCLLFFIFIFLKKKKEKKQAVIKGLIKLVHVIKQEVETEKH